MLHVADLFADEGLELIPRSSHCVMSHQPIGWVSTFEAIDQTPYLQGHELLLTLGLRRRSARDR